MGLSGAHVEAAPSPPSDLQQPPLEFSAIFETPQQKASQKMFSCSVCKKSFSSQSNLKSHQLIHTDEKPFSCSVCSRAFRQRQSMQSHMRTHTGERPFECPNQGSHLRTHRRHVHAGGKQFICDRCGKTYADQRYLRLHKCCYA
ncbi:hypothetical protein GOODEAATRI_025840 [Goodea atripinnis]|uniref:C2H2-type domain-containing protein n=1 Tax=Goodea atripinnis TaxID=208336 RepID=A0ABV0N4A7_9TELE